MLRRSCQGPLLTAAVWSPIILSPGMRQYRAAHRDQHSQRQRRKDVLAVGEAVERPAFFSRGAVVLSAFNPGTG